MAEKAKATVVKSLHAHKLYVKVNKTLILSSVYCIISQN